jgi:hypothetical protein
VPSLRRVRSISSITAPRSKRSIAGALNATSLSLSAIAVCRRASLGSEKGRRKKRGVADGVAPTPALGPPVAYENTRTKGKATNAREGITVATGPLGVTSNRVVRAVPMPLWPSGLGRALRAIGEAATLGWRLGGPSREVRTIEPAQPVIAWWCIEPMTFMVRTR